MRGPVSLLVLVAAVAAGCGPGADSPKPAPPVAPAAAPGDPAAAPAPQAPATPPTVGDYDPKNDPLVNVPSIREPLPKDPSQVAEDEWLYSSMEGSPGILNPMFTSSSYEFRVEQLTMDTWYTYDSKFLWRTNDAFCESFTESPDHKVWTVRLKPGLKWQDGHPLTAEDYAWSWRQVMDPLVPAIKDKDNCAEFEVVEAVDERTIRYVHKRPLPTSKWNVSYPILPKHLFEKGKKEDPTLKTSPYFSRLNREWIGNGPYKLVEWKENDKLVFDRWDDYAGPKPHFKRIVIRLIPDVTTALLTFEKGDSDEMRLTAKQFAGDTVASPTFRKVGVKAHGPQWDYAFIAWNMDGSNPFFNDVRVRRAMTHACNIPLIIKKITYGLATQCYGPFHPDSWMFNPEVKLIPFDLKESGRLLDEAGWKVSDEDGWRHKGERKFAFTMLIANGSQAAIDMCAILQQDLKSIGVEMKTQIMDWAAMSQKVEKHEFEAETAAWGTGVDPDFQWNLWHSEAYANGRNHGGFKDPRVDELLLKGREEFDFEKRRKCYREIQKIIYDEQPYTFVYNRPMLWAFNKRIRGVEYSPRGPWLFDPSVMAWWVRKGEQVYGSK